MVPLVPELEPLAASMRTPTPEYLKTGARRRVAALRAGLAPEDRELLLLRVTRKLEWDEIARILGDAEAPTTADLARTSAALRKRYERLKTSLRAKVGRKSG